MMMRSTLLLCFALLVGCQGAREKARAEAAVRGQLRDPESAQFSNIRVLDGPNPVVCGEVNARNGFGGYVGRRKFFAAQIGDSYTAQIVEPGGKTYCDLVDEAEVEVTREERERAGNNAR